MERKQSWLAILTFAMVATVTCSLCHAESDEDTRTRIPIGTAKVSVLKVRADLMDQLQMAQQRELLQADDEVASDTTLADAASADQDASESSTLVNASTEETESPLLIVDSEGQLALPSACSDCTKKATYIFFETEPIDYHHVSLYAYGAHSCVLETEDGALWRITSDPSVILDWYQSNDVLIYPSPWWVSSPFELYNRQTRTSVYANLEMGPFYNESNTRWVVDLNWNTGEVWLSDGSYWLVSNMSRFQDWGFNHTVMIGTNNEWLTDYPYLLINVNLYDPLYPKYSYVKAVCITGPVY